MQFTAQRYRLAKRLRPTRRTLNASPPPTPHHHITKGLLAATAFTQCVVSIARRITRQSKAAITVGRGGGNIRIRYARDVGVIRLRISAYACPI